MALVAIPCDRWALAYAQLTDKDKTELGTLSAIGAQDVILVIEKWKSPWHSKQWNIKIGSTRTINLREVFQTMANWIQKFIEVGDVAAQYDPIHAALPWAAVRLLLKASINDVGRYAVICEGVETICRIMVYCRVVDAMHLQHSKDTTEGYQAAVVELYKSILVYLAKAKRYFSEKTAKRIFKGFSSFADKYAAHLATIRRQQQELDRWVQSIDLDITQDISTQLETLSIEDGHRHEYLKNILAGLAGSLTRIEMQVDDIHGMSSSIAQTATQVNDIHRMSSTIHQTTTQVTNNIHNVSNTIHQTALHVNDTRISLSTARRSNIMAWLSEQPHFTYHRTQHKKVLRGTCTWLLTDPDFLRWQDSSTSAILWLHGSMGSGKSCLTSAVVALQLTRFDDNLSPRPHYFYCKKDPQQKERSDAASILGSIARQMCCLEEKGDILQAAVELYEKSTEQGSRSPTMEESIDLIIRMSEARSVTYIIIDALDECDMEPRGALLIGLQRIRESASHVKIFLSSRDDPDIIVHFATQPHIRVKSSKTKEDIDLFIEDAVDQSSKRDLLFGRASADLVRLIKTALSKGADGMFRWVELQLQYICSLKSQTAIKDRLGKLPRTLQAIYEDVYDTSISSLDDHERSIPATIFSWLFCAEEEIRSKDFALAVGWGVHDLELSIEQILHYSFGLVSYDDEEDLFKFTHLSAREFLEGKKNYAPAYNHATAAIACVRSLSGLRKRLGTFHYINYHRDYNYLIPYAVRYWPHHSREAGVLRLEGELSQALSTLLARSGQSSAFVEWCHHADRYHQEVLCNPPNPAFVVCAYSFTELLDDMLQTRTLPRNLTNAQAASLLAVSSRHGDLTIVRKLLDYGFDVNHGSSDRRTPNALYAACQEGHADIVELLLSHGANMKLEGGEYGLALHAACYHAHEDVVHKLLDHGADPNSVAGPYDYPLHTACFDGRYEVWATLRNRGVDTDLSPQHIRATAIARTVNALLWYGADVQKADRKGRNAMYWACWNAMPELVKLLLAHGMKVDALKHPPEKNFVNIAWGCGITGSRGRVIELLLDAGAKVPLSEDVINSAEWADEGLKARLLQVYHHDKSKKDGIQWESSDDEADNRVSDLKFSQQPNIMHLAVGEAAIPSSPVHELDIDKQPEETHSKLPKRRHSFYDDMGLLEVGPWRLEAICTKPTWLRFAERRHSFSGLRHDTTCHWCSYERSCGHLRDKDDLWCTTSREFLEHIPLPENHKWADLKLVVDVNEPSAVWMDTMSNVVGDLDY